VKFTTDSRRLRLVIHDHTSSNLWSFELEASLGYADKVLCVCVFKKTVECSCHTGLYKVTNVRVWKLQC